MSWVYRYIIVSLLIWKWARYNHGNSTHKKMATALTILPCWFERNAHSIPSYFFGMLLSLQELEENLRDAQSTAQRMETQLVQKERLFEDKIKVGQPHTVPNTLNIICSHIQSHCTVLIRCQFCRFNSLLWCRISQSCHSNRQRTNYCFHTRLYIYNHVSMLLFCFIT